MEMRNVLSGNFVLIPRVIESSRAERVPERGGDFLPKRKEREEFLIGELANHPHAPNGTDEHMAGGKGNIGRKRKNQCVFIHSPSLDFRLVQKAQDFIATITFLMCRGYTKLYDKTSG